MFHKLHALLPALAVAALLSAPLHAEDKTTNCPPGKPNCTQTAKPTASPEKAPRVDNSISEVIFNRENEARKARVNAATKYRDPGAVSLCPPPRHMTAMDGCQ